MITDWQITIHQRNNIVYMYILFLSNSHPRSPVFVISIYSHIKCENYARGSKKICSENYTHAKISINTVIERGSC